MTIRKRFRHTIRTIKQALSLKQLRQTFYFFTLFMLMTPSYKDFLDYYYNLSVIPDASIEIMVFSCVFIASIIYSIYLEDKEMRFLVQIALVAYIINTFFNILLVQSTNQYGLPTIAYVGLQTVFFDTPF